MNENKIISSVENKLNNLDLTDKDTTKNTIIKIVKEAFKEVKEGNLLGEDDSIVDQGLKAAVICIINIVQDVTFLICISSLTIQHVTVDIPCYER